MARRPTLSPSKISTYLACPVKYRWTYVDPRGRYYSRAKSYYSFGTTLHRVLERFHDAADAGVTTTHEALAALEESWISAGYQSAQEMQEALGEGKAIVESYVDQVHIAPRPTKTLAVEREMRLDMGRWDLLGRIDRLDEHPDGALEIIDYKSGRREMTEEDARCDLALACYQILVRAAHPDRRVFASLLSLRSGALVSAELTDEEAEEVRRDLLFIGDEMLDRDYESITPIRKPLCDTCDFLPLCRTHPDFAES